MVYFFSQINELPFKENAQLEAVRILKYSNVLSKTSSNSRILCLCVLFLQINPWTGNHEIWIPNVILLKISWACDFSLGFSFHLESERVELYDICGHS